MTKADRTAAAKKAWETRRGKKPAKKAKKTKKKKKGLKPWGKGHPLYDWQQAEKKKKAAKKKKRK